MQVNPASEDDRLQQLLALAVKGDRQALGQLYEIFEREMLAAARRQRGSGLAALLESRDLIQSVWKDVLNDWDQFEYRGPDAFAHWLQILLRNKIRAKGRFHAAAKRDFHKKVGLAENGAGDPTGAVAAKAGVPTPSQVFSRKEERQRLQAVLATFPELQQRIMVMRLHDQLSYEQIGQTLGKSQEAVKKAYGRGLKRLMQALLDVSQSGDRLS
ncbi:MAG: hypothetical protein DWQ01_12870 [Planctomycetota bacterium]|nr:MAG: hypothetical protein DWQ01_12870 [Planctomycetota bacterium]